MQYTKYKKQAYTFLISNIKKTIIHIKVFSFCTVRILKFTTHNVGTLQHSKKSRWKHAQTQHYESMAACITGAFFLSHRLSSMNIENQIKFGGPAEHSKKSEQWI